LVRYVHISVRKTLSLVRYALFLMKKTSREAPQVSAAPFYAPLSVWLLPPLGTNAAARLLSVP
jgi:hypothetical protein